MKKIIFPNSAVHSGSLILVNGQCPYDEDKTEYALVAVSEAYGNVLMERRAVVLLSKLMDDIHGWARIAAVSGYRSLREQQDIWSQSLIENGAKFTREFVAAPGHSEHQTGLAIDLGLKQPNIDFIRPEFPYDGICQTFRENATMFGFVERYPKGKVNVTGIGHEPWHFRYVGVPHAAIMREYEFTLEEYIAFIRQFPYGAQNYTYQKDGRNVAVSFLHAAKGSDTEIEMDAEKPYSVSGNNTDGFIITQWRGKNG